MHSQAEPGNELKLSSGRSYDQPLLSVLRGEEDAPRDLRERALLLVGHILELSSSVPSGKGRILAQEALDSGRAWRKFQAICEAQGGMREPPCAQFTHVVTATREGHVVSIDNRRLARVAKLAGAPSAPAAGLELHTCIGTTVEKGQPLFTIHAETPGELAYALAYVDANPNTLQMEELA
ncbi:MAG: hypothetical protein MN733_14755 [Nitrososphaera sp.]|nr:hypothetical protein [Nitrososphaera sp.]